MSLKNVFNTMRNSEGYVIKDLDMYLLQIANREDENRAIDVNAPSQIGKCMRARYYARTHAPSDPNNISARAKRIFDNGTGTHERLQKYLKDMGKLLMDELPVHNGEYNIQGHTDGALALEPYSDGDDPRYADEIGVLEIKSINERGFNQLKDAKEEHKKQGLVYVFALEERRKELHKLYPTSWDFFSSRRKRMKRYAKLYQHIKGGRKHTKAEKIAFQCELHDILDNILYRLKKPVTKAIFLYENKNTQDLKEFTVTASSSEAKNILKSVLTECAELNDCVKNEVVPQREGSSKNSECCRWCNYTIHCWH